MLKKSKEIIFIYYKNIKYFYFKYLIFGEKKENRLKCFAY